MSILLILWVCSLACSLACSITNGYDSPFVCRFRHNLTRTLQIFQFPADRDGRDIKLLAQPADACEDLPPPDRGSHKRGILEVGGQQEMEENPHRSGVPVPSPLGHLRIYLDPAFHIRNQ